MKSTTFQSGECGCTLFDPAKYYAHPISALWGGAKKRNQKKQKGGEGCALQDDGNVVTAAQQRGAVLYGGKKKTKSRKQKGGESSLIPTTPSTPEMLSGQGPFTDPNPLWKQAGTGSGLGQPVHKMNAEQITMNKGLGYETSGGARKTTKRKTSAKKTTKPRKQKGGEEFPQDKLNILEDKINQLGSGKSKAKKTTKKAAPKKTTKKTQRGGGSDFLMVHNSRGPINYPTMSPEKFNIFTKTGQYLTNQQLMDMPLSSPMFNEAAPRGYNYYCPY
jgi:hypothetical protein